MAVVAVSIAISTTRRSNHYAADTTKQTFDGRYAVDSVIVTLSIALALYNSLEMALLISTTFKKWKGLYFWSLSLCNLGVICYTLGLMLQYFTLGVRWFNLALNDAGWIGMITCQSLVLYSRLGLILDSNKILTAVKWMIIIDSVVFLISTVVLNFGSTFSAIPSFDEGYFYIEHIQMTVITVQELIISGLYIWKTISLLKVISKAHTRSMVWQLFTINIIIIAMDIALVVLEFKHLQLYQESIKAFVYSVKLKLELNILSKLVDLIDGGRSNIRSMTLTGIIDSDAILGQAAIRREMSPSSGPDHHFGSRFAGDGRKGTAAAAAAAAAVHRKNSSSLTTTTNTITAAATVTATATAAAPLDAKNDEWITPVVSQQSRWSARTKDRESDVLYANVLRSLS